MIKSLSDHQIIACSSVPKTATALMYSCQQGDYHRTNSILKKYPQAVYNRDNTNKNALHYCSESKDVQCADLILATAPDLIHTTDEDGFTPLHLAVIAGNLKLINFLLSNKANVNAVDNEKHTIVHWAIVCKETDVLRTILAAGAPVSTPDIHGGYPLHYASQMCGMEQDSDTGLQILHILLSHPNIDIKVKDRDGRSPILWAASSGSARAVLALYKAGIPIETADTEGLTALHCAASRGHTDCLDTIITLCGADVNSIDNNGCTPLHYAVTLGHADATALLLMHAADFEKVDKKGRAAVHCGCAKGQLETIKLLKSYGADLWRKNNYGDFPLHNAVASNRIDLVKWLLDQNQKFVNATNNNGRTPLHIAALKDNANMCKVLLDHGADINAIYKTAKNILMTPFDCAAYYGYKNTAKFIQLNSGVSAKKLDSLTSGEQPNRSETSETVDCDSKMLKKSLHKESYCTKYEKNCPNDVHTSESEIEYEYMQSIEMKKYQRKTKSCLFNKKLKKNNQLTNVISKKKKVQKYFNEPTAVSNITDTDKNEMESIDEDGLKKSQGTPETILADSTNEEIIVNVEEIAPADNNIVHSAKVVEHEPIMDLNTGEQVEKEIQQIHQELENNSSEIQNDSENNKNESIHEEVIKEDILIDEKAFEEKTEMSKEIFDNENNEKLEESLKIATTNIVDNAVSDVIIEQIDKNNNNVSPETKNDLPENKIIEVDKKNANLDSNKETETDIIRTEDSNDNDKESTEDVKNNNANSSREIARHRKKSNGTNLPLKNKIGIERSVQIESNVPFEIIDDNAQVITSSKSKKKIEIETDKKLESFHTIPDSKKNLEKYESFSVLNNEKVVRTVDPSFHIIPATPSSSSAMSETSTNEKKESLPEITPSSSSNNNNGANPKKDNNRKIVTNVSDDNSVLPGIVVKEKSAFTVLKSNAFSDLDEKSSNADSFENSKKRSKSIHRFKNVEAEDNYNSVQIPDLKNKKASITQKVQSNIRTYYVERKIFNELLELKRLQIRSGQANEAALTKRLVDTYNKSSMATVGLGPYKSKDYSYKSFEKFLYDTLRKLNSDNDSFSEYSSSYSSIDCGKHKYRCPHVAHACSEIPCLGSLNKTCEKKKYITMEICNGTERKVISLPAEKFDPYKKYFVTFSVKEKDKSGNCSVAEDKKTDKVISEGDKKT